MLLYELVGIYYFFFFKFVWSNVSFLLRGCSKFLVRELFLWIVVFGVSLLIRNEKILEFFNVSK